MTVHNYQQLFWGQGQFLTPQHLQQMDLFHQGQSQLFWKLSVPFGWGVDALEIDEAGLAANRFEIRRCRIVTREGLVLNAGSGGDANVHIAPRNFVMPPGSTKIPVYLWLPEHNPAENNICSGNDDALPGRATRYRSRARECKDLFDKDQADVEVFFVEYNLVIVFEFDDAFRSLKKTGELYKIAELVQAQSKSSEQLSARLSERFVPPSLTIASSPVLWNLLKNFRDVLTAKSETLAQLKRQRGVRASVAGLQDLLRLTMFQTLARYLPIWHHHLELGIIAPEQAYGLLRQMVGDLSVFSEQVTPLGAPLDDTLSPLPRYDHNDLWGIFDQAIRIALKLVDQIAWGPEESIRLTYDGKEYFHAKLPPSLFEGERTRYYLLIDSKVSGIELWNRLNRTGKISADEDMATIRPFATMGLEIQYLNSPPTGLNRGGLYTYFQIDTKSKLWDGIRKNCNIVVFCGLDPNDTTIELLWVRED